MQSIPSAAVVGHVCRAQAVEAPAPSQRHSHSIDHILVHAGARCGRCTGSARPATTVATSGAHALSRTQPRLRNNCHRLGYMHLQVKRIAGPWNTVASLGAWGPVGCLHGVVLARGRSPSHQWHASAIPQKAAHGCKVDLHGGDRRHSIELPGLLPAPTSRDARLPCRPAAPYIAATGGCCSHLPVALLACLLWLARNHEKANPRTMSDCNGYGYNPAACTHQRATMHGERPPRHARKLNSPKRTQCTNTQTCLKRRRGLTR